MVNGSGEWKQINPKGGSTTPDDEIIYDGGGVEGDGADDNNIYEGGDV
jgi:hypothetical protein